jgi:hypothetical protein
MDNKIISLLEKKGIWSSVAGLQLAFALNWFYIGHFRRGVEIPEWQTGAFIGGSVIAMGYLMLPSVIEISSKLFKFIIKD